jgi:hypothetical protein
MEGALNVIETCNKLYKVRKKPLRKENDVSSFGSQIVTH